MDRAEQILGLAPLGSMQVLLIYMSLPLTLSLLCQFAVVIFGLVTTVVIFGPVTTCSMLLLLALLGLLLAFRSVQQVLAVRSCFACWVCSLSALGECTACQINGFELKVCRCAVQYLTHDMYSHMCSHSTCHFRHLQQALAPWLKEGRKEDYITPAA